MLAGIRRSPAFSSTETFQSVVVVVVDRETPANAYTAQRSEPHAHGDSQRTKASADRIYTHTHTHTLSHTYTHTHTRARSILGCGGCLSVRVRVRVRVRYFRVTHRLQNRQYFGRHGINVSTGYQLPPLDMGPCAGRCALDAILCRGASS